MRKFLFSIAILSTLGLVSGCAPTPAATTAAAPLRNPNLGDPGPIPGAATGPARPSAAALTNADRQPPGTTNGNQPDRAAAAGGAR